MMHDLKMHVHFFFHTIGTNKLVVIWKEHFYNGESGSGWRLKTVQRRSASSESRELPRQLTGWPAARREASFTPEMTLSEEQCKDAVALMKYCTDEATIKEKMKITFEYSRSMVLNEERSSDVLTEFPRFKDIKGLVIDYFKMCICPVSINVLTATFLSSGLFNLINIRSNC